MTRQFAYLRDELFVASSVLYVANRTVSDHFASTWSNDFLRYHFNDLLLVPVAVPPILACSQVLGLRVKGAPPRYWEVLIPVLVWTLAFELIGPRWFGRGTSDPLDAAAYLLGGLASFVAWRRPRKKSPLDAVDR